MISSKLQFTFNVLENAVFPKWQKANDKEKLKITKKLGIWEAKQILKEIDLEVEKKFKK